MVGGKLKCGYADRHRSRPCNSRKCKEKSGLTIIDSLPDDLLFHILVELPARDIYDGARLVCKKWHNVIRNHRFIHEHLHRSTPGLLIRYCFPWHDNKVFMAMREGKVEISKLTYKFKEAVWASCNGLTVEPDSRKVYSPYITNPATKQCLALPQVTPLITEYYSVIAYVASSMQYKVVLNHGCRERWTLPMHNCLILTVGVDKLWRRLQIAHVRFPAMLFFMCAPLVTGGFIHWTNGGSFDVLTLNVETEIFTHNPVPQGYNEKGWKYYLSTGRSLTLVIEHGEFSWEVLKMKSETGKWTEMSVIDLEPRKDKIRSLVRKCPNARVKPVGWLNYEEVLVFYISPTRNCVLYDVRTRDIVFFKLDYGSENLGFTAHRNTLVPLAGC